MFPRCYFPGGGPQRAYSWPELEADGPLMTPLAKAVELAGASSVLRVRCGLDGNDAYGSEKLIDGYNDFPKRIFYPERDESKWNNAFPVIVFMLGADWGWDPDAGGYQNYLRASGSIDMLIVDDDRYPSDRAASTLDFGTFVGNFVQDLIAQFALSDALAGNRVSTIQRPLLPPVSEAAARGRDRWSAIYALHWSS